MQTLKLGISPCPNDTYIFGGLVTGRVAASGLRFETTLADVETLNLRAADYDVVKVSVAAAAGMLEDFVLLDCGGALGRGCGPLLVARDLKTPPQKVAIPGRNTTAALLLKLSQAVHGAELMELTYDRVADAVVNGKVDAGVLIHESRFTYADLGLSLLLDLGAWWEEDTGLPIPLGVIAIRRSLGPGAAGQVAGAIRASLAYARSHETELWPYIREHAQELSDEVIAAHIDMFVTGYSDALGEGGRGAVLRLLAAAGAGAPAGSVFIAPHAG